MILVCITCVSFMPGRGSLLSPTHGHLTGDSKGFTGVGKRGEKRRKDGDEGSVAGKGRRSGR